MLLLRRPDVLDGSGDFVVSALVDLAAGNPGIAAANLTRIGASAGLVVFDADTGVPAVFGELRAVRAVGATADSPALCVLRVSNHSVTAPDTVKSSGKAADPCTKGVGAWGWQRARGASGACFPPPSVRHGEPLVALTAASRPAPLR